MAKTALLLGSTGMVGNQVLQELLTNKEITKITLINRKKQPIKNKKVTEIIYNDFNDFSPIKESLQNIDLCYYCIGVYQNNVSKEDFFKITCDYQEALTKELEIQSPKAKFMLFSAQGADSTEKSKVTFAKAKGMAENQLKKTSFPTKLIFRPGYIHATTKKRPQDLTYRLFTPIASVLFKLFPSIGITDHDLGRGMVVASLNLKNTEQTYENNQIKTLLNND